LFSGSVVRLPGLVHTLASIMLAVGLSGVCVPAVGQGLPEDLAGLVSRAAPSVVSISALRAPATDGHDGRSLGTGFVVDASGLVVTNNHVIAGASEIHVTFPDGTRRVARLAGADGPSDLALLRVPRDRVLQPLALGDSDGARPGDWVVAIGSPYGLGGSVSAGIISARHRQIETESLEDFIQSDAAINRGSSGGPLMNLKGEVIGVNSALVSPNGGSAGISFAVPANTLKFVIARILKHGIVQRGWVGASALDLTPDLASAFGIPKRTGALIGSVVPAGPAAKSGLLPGDIITEAGGAVIVDARAFQRRVAEAEPGSQLKVSVTRRGQAQPAMILVGMRPGARGAAKAPAATVAAERGLLLGLGLEELTPALRARLGLGSASPGLRVRVVAAASPAAEADIRVGDLVVEVGQKAVVARQSVKDLLRNERAQGKPFALLTVSRGGVTLFKALRLSERPFDTAYSTSGR
jgi:serine protease Do